MVHLTGLRLRPGGSRFRLRVIRNPINSRTTCSATLLLSNLVPVGAFKTLFVITKCSGPELKLGGDQRKIYVDDNNHLGLKMVLNSEVMYVAKCMCCQMIANLSLRMSNLWDVNWLGAWKMAESVAERGGEGKWKTFRLSPIVENLTDYLELPVHKNELRNRWSRNVSTRWFTLKVLAGTLRKSI